MVFRRAEPSSSDPRKPLYCAAERPLDGSSRHFSPTPDRTRLLNVPVPLRVGLSLACLGALATAPITAQVLDETMVPRGYVRLQAHGVFDSWGDRFGRSWDGTERLEALGEDLTDPTGYALYPGLSTLGTHLRALGAAANYAPVLGASTGHVTRDLTTIDWGIDIGVFDWLTVGGVLPWSRPRTAIDLYVDIDTINGDLGVSPIVTNPTGVDAFLGSTAGASTSSQANADALCAGGLTPACANAQALAQRARDFNAAVQGAYGASPFFPTSGSAAADAFSATAATLDADLLAAGLTGLSPVVLAAARATADDLAALPLVSGGGIEGLPLRTSPGLYAAGDAEVYARVRLLDNLTPARRPRVAESEIGSLRRPRPGIGYQLIATGLARLPTGQRENPDRFLDNATGDGQLDIEGGLVGSVVFGGRLGITAGARYTQQRATTVTKRVAPPETPMPTVDTRTELTWTPGDYVAVGVAPTLYIADGLTLSAEYRYFEKQRDEYALVMPGLPLDPVVLELESGIKQHHVGGGLRYSTVSPWLWGEAAWAIEMHVRLLHAVAGSGGQAPESTRVEAGLRLFRKLWGETPEAQPGG